MGQMSSGIRSAREPQVEKTFVLLKGMSHRCHVLVKKSTSHLWAVLSYPYFGRFAPPRPARDPPLQQPCHVLFLLGKPIQTNGVC